MSQLLRTLCNAMWKSLGKKFTQCAEIFFLSVSDEAEQELVTEQIKSIVSELQQIKGDSGMKLILGKWAAAQELDTDTTLDCGECGKHS